MRERETRSGGERGERRERESRERGRERGREREEEEGGRNKLPENQGLSRRVWCGGPRPSVIMPSKSSVGTAQRSAQSGERSEKRKAAKEGEREKNKKEKKKKAVSPGLAPSGRSPAAAVRPLSPLRSPCALSLAALSLAAQVRLHALRALGKGGREWKARWCCEIRLGRCPRL